MHKMLNCNFLDTSHLSSSFGVWICISWLWSRWFYHDWVISDTNSQTGQQEHSMKGVDSRRVSTSSSCWEVSFPDETPLSLNNFPFLFTLWEVLREDIPSHWCFAQKFSIICRQAVFGCLARIIPQLCMPTRAPSIICVGSLCSASVIKVFCMIPALRDILSHALIWSLIKYILRSYGFAKRLPEALILPWERNSLF